MTRPGRKVQNTPPPLCPRMLTPLASQGNPLTFLKLNVGFPSHTKTRVRVHFMGIRFEASPFVKGFRA